MNIRRSSLASAVILAVAVGSTDALAKDPCGTELCMSGEASGFDPSECEEHVENFFDIVKYKNGHKSPSRTFNARRKFLNSCESGNDDDKARILAAFGMVFR